MKQVERKLIYVACTIKKLSTIGDFHCRTNKLIRLLGLAWPGRVERGLIQYSGMNFHIKSTRQARARARKVHQRERVARLTWTEVAAAQRREKKSSNRVLVLQVSLPLSLSLSLFGVENFSLDILTELSERYIALRKSFSRATPLKNYIFSFAWVAKLIWCLEGKRLARASDNLKVCARYAKERERERLNWNPPPKFSALKSYLHNGIGML